LLWQCELVLRAGTTLPPILQRSALSLVTMTSRTRLRRRTAPLPPLGVPGHLTAVLRVGEGVVPDIRVGHQHYVYPKHTVHVTVSNLDRAAATVDAALERLSCLTLEAPMLTLEGLGCSSDTLFIRCVHDPAFGRLREMLVDAFEVRRPAAPISWAFTRVTYANVVRFQGPGEWISLDLPTRHVRCTELEIVRTDRFLSDAGTTVLARVPIGR
jgi:hypothetical protein